jgi:hypothetical protein
MMEALYKKYLKAYIEKLTLDKDIYYISICDIEYEIIELLINFKIEGIEIAIVNKFDYSAAVKYRNDTTVNKIVILTPDSVKKIDSLKDFNEYSIFPEIEEKSDLFWSIIKSVFILKKAPSSREIKFINLIIKEKRITLSQFFELIDGSMENNEINIKNLNKNLNLVNCWKSNGESGTKLAPLRKLIRLSDPTEIEKRVSIMQTETLDDKELKEFTLISKLSFENKYAELFKRFYFEKLPNKFTIKSVNIKKVKSNGIDDNEATKQYRFSYEAYMEESQSIPIDLFENEIKDNMKEQFTQSSDEFETELFRVSIDIIIIKIDTIIDDIRKGINIQLNAQENLMKKIEVFKYETINIYNDLKENKEYPHMLNKFCIRTRKFLESYVSLLSFIAIDENILEGLGENKIIEDIQNLFITPDEDKLIMSFMHPISIFYFNCINDKFKEIMSDYKKYDSNSVRILLDGILNINKTRFPINIITFNNKSYVINDNFKKVFTYYEFREKTQMSSENSLDIRTIGNSMAKYLLQFPYKSEVVMSIIGNPSFKNIGSLKKIIDAFLLYKLSIIQKLRIDIISENHKIISQEIDEFYRNENYNNKIQFRLLTAKLDKYGNYNIRAFLNDAINKSDIVLLFDCYLLYKREEIKRITYNYNSYFNEISAIGCSNNLGDQVDQETINLNFPIEILWTTLHNMLLNNNNSLSKWIINELDNAIVNLIMPEIESNNELMVCMITSNLNIINKIYMKKNFSSNIIRSKGKEFLELSFGSYIENSYLNDNATEFNCTCSLKSILESILDDGEIEEFVKDMQYEPNEILEDLVIKFNCNNKNDSIQIICYYPEDENESFREEEYKNICEFILNYSFCNSNSHSKLLKSIIINYLYSSIKNYGDALLVNYIERYFKLNIDIDVSYIRHHDNYRISQDMNTTNVRSMISYIETNSIDERFKTDFNYGYDIGELKEMRRQANMMNIVDDKLLKKMDFILKGEQ